MIAKLCVRTRLRKGFLQPTQFFQRLLTGKPQRISVVREGPQGAAIFSIAGLRRIGSVPYFNSLQCVRKIVVHLNRDRRGLCLRKCVNDLPLQRWTWDDSELRNQRVENGEWILRHSKCVLDWVANLSICENWRYFALNVFQARFYFGIKYAQDARNLSTLPLRFALPLLFDLVGANPHCGKNRGDRSNGLNPGRPVELWNKVIRAPQGECCAATQCIQLPVATNVAGFGCHKAIVS